MEKRKSKKRSVLLVERQRTCMFRLINNISALNDRETTGRTDFNGKEFIRVLNKIKNKFSVIEEYLQKILTR